MQSVDTFSCVFAKYIFVEKKVICVITLSYNLLMRNAMDCSGKKEIIMKKKITAILLAATALSSAFALTGCSSHEDKRNTVYDIDATLSEDYTLACSVTCDYVNNTDVPLSELWFHLYPNAYRNGATYSPIPASKTYVAYPAGKSYSVLDITDVEVNGNPVDVVITGTDENILSVSLPSAIDPTDSAKISIEYTVKLPNVKHRFGYADKVVNLANFYPIACMYRDGAFVADPYYSTGDPFFSDVADYNVKLTAPSKYTGAFTGTLTSKADEGGNTTYNIKADNVRDFAAVFGEFEKMSGVAGSTIVNYFYTTDSEPERSLNAAIDAIKTFGDMFGAYAYPEYSVVQTSFIHGGMEYPGLSMISDAYKGDPYIDIIVHETAHQWWYAAVGNDEVRNAWLDEGLTEYSTMLFYQENTEGYAYTFDSKRADALTAYMLYCETYKHNGLDDISMTRAINEYEDDTEYSYMIYVKGALMLDDVRNTVGDAAFMQALKNYYADNKFAIAEPQNLIGAMENASHRKLEGLFNAWLDGNVKLYGGK